MRDPIHLGISISIITRQQVVLVGVSTIWEVKKPNEIKSLLSGSLGEVGQKNRNKILSLY